MLDTLDVLSLPVLDVIATCQEMIVGQQMMLFNNTSRALVALPSTPKASSSTRLSKKQGFILLTFLMILAFSNIIDTHPSFEFIKWKLVERAYGVDTRNQCPEYLRNTLEQSRLLVKMEHPRFSPTTVNSFAMSRIQICKEAYNEKARDMFGVAVTVAGIWLMYRYFMA